MQDQDRDLSLTKNIYGENDQIDELLGPPTFIFSGYAKTPANAITPFGSGILALEIEVDPYDLKIVDAACECLPSLGRKFVITSLVGKTVEDGLKAAVREVRDRYYGITQRAIISAIEDLFRHFLEFKQKKGIGRTK